MEVGDPCRVGDSLTLKSIIMSTSKNFNRPFKACMANCQHPDENIRLLLTDSRSIDSPSDDLVDACNTICCLCHSY